MAEQKEAKYFFQSKTIKGLALTVASFATMIPGLDLTQILGKVGGKWAPFLLGGYGLFKVLAARIKDGSKLALTPSGLKKLLAEVTEAVSGDAAEETQKEGA